MLKNFIKAARLRTLPLSVSGIIVGSFLGSKTPVWQSSIFWLAIITTIGFQVLSNFANDYGDGVKGTDDNREGEQRLVASGIISSSQMKNAIVVTTVFTLLVALSLIYVSFGKDNFLYSVIFFVLGVVSIIAAIKYTVGKSAYGYSGFGDIFVFIFFGLLAVVGTYFLHTKRLNFIIFLPAISVGLLSTAVLNLNNMRDRISDEKSSKNTLVVKMGSKKAKIYHYLLIVFALISALIYTFLTYHSLVQLLFLVAFIPLFINIATVAKNKILSELDAELKKVALSTFLFSILLGMGQIL